jgi:hypothetical protein
MTFFTKHKALITGILFGALIVSVTAQITTDRKLSYVTDSLDGAIESSLSEAIALAALIGSGALTTGAQSIIEDCSEEERESFETKLSQLDSGLSMSELQEVDVLFSRCAPTQSIRRTLMVLDLGRQVQNVSELITQRNQIERVDAYNEKVEVLSDLIVYEEDIARLSLDLVYLQREIIDILMSGVAVDSVRSEELKMKGSTVRSSMQEKAARAADLRTELSTL